MIEERTFCPGCPRRGAFMAVGKLRCVATGDIVCDVVGASPPRPKGPPKGAPKGSPKGAPHRPPQAVSREVMIIDADGLVDHGLDVLTELAQEGGNTLSVILVTGAADPRGEGERTDVAALCRDLGLDRVRTMGPNVISEIADALREEADIDSPSVLVIDAPCTLRPDAEKRPAFWVDEDKCEGCEHCFKVDCSAMSVVARPDGSEMVRIAAAECEGCGICVQLCKHDAIFAGRETL